MQDLAKSGIVFVVNQFLFLLIKLTVEQQQEIIVRIANIGDIHFAETITNEMEASAKARAPA